MTLLSRKADYALLILSYLHDQAEGGNARLIAEKFGLSRAFVANILKELCRIGFVTSNRGVKGGYVLRPESLEKTLAFLLESIDEEFRFTVCSTPIKDERCSLESTCTLRSPLTEIHTRLLAVLRGVTLKNIFEFNVSASPNGAIPMMTINACQDHPCDRSAIHAGKSVEPAPV